MQKKEGGIQEMKNKTNYSALYIDTIEIIVSIIKLTYIFTNSTNNCLVESVFDNITVVVFSVLFFIVL